MHIHIDNTFVNATKVNFVSWILISLTWLYSNNTASVCKLINYSWAQPSDSIQWHHKPVVLHQKTWNIEHKSYELLSFYLMMLYTAFHIKINRLSHVISQPAFQSMLELLFWRNSAGSVRTFSPCRIPQRLFPDARLSIWQTSARRVCVCGSRLPVPCCWLRLHKAVFRSDWLVRKNYKNLGRTGFTLSAIVLITHTHTQTISAQTHIYNKKPLIWAPSGQVSLSRSLSRPGHMRGGIIQRGRGHGQHKLTHQSK